MSKVDRFVGDLSYPVYIVHEVIAYVIIDRFKAQAPWIVYMYLPLILAAALTLLYGLEQPIDRYRQYLAKRNLARQSVKAAIGEQPSTS